VATAGNGAEALDYLRRSPAPGAILLDLVMPEMDGWSVLKARNDDPALRDIPVVVISGQPDVAAQVKRANATYFGKPIRPDKLIALLESTGMNSARSDRNDDPDRELIEALVPAERAGKRFDQALAEMFPEFSRSRLSESSSSLSPRSRVRSWHLDARNTCARARGPA